MNRKKQGSTKPLLRILKRVGKILFSIILAVSFACSIFTIVVKLVTPTKFPMLFGWSNAGILSGSMEPTLSQGDYVIIHKQEHYRLNDIVVYYDEIDKVFVIHRIVGFDGDEFITQGDFNPACDPNPVSLKNVQGKVVYVLPNLQAFLYIGLGAAGTLFIQGFVKVLKSKEGGNEQNEKQSD